MNWKRLAGFSLLLNVVVLVWLFASGQKTGAGRDSRASESAGQPFTPQPTSPIPESAVRKFDWSRIESTNYLEYVANLRSIGCPEQTIRDIVAADVAATLRGIAFADASAPAVGTWREDPERLVDDLMGGSDVQVTVPSNRDVASSREISHAIIAARDRHGILEPYAESGVPNRTESFASAGAAVSDNSKGSVPAEASATDAFSISAEIARQRWIATYLSTRYGQQAWNDFQRQSTDFGGDIDALLQHRDISVPEPPQRLLPVAR